MITKLTFEDLFNWEEERCDLSKVSERKSDMWKCGGDLRFAKQFCDEKGIDFEAVKKLLNDAGGFCDCEVLFNSSIMINKNKKLPKIEVK